MHSPDFFSASVCHSGCQCKEGYVLDTSTKRCVKPTECPCHHGGRSYKENSTVQSDCNTWSVSFFLYFYLSCSENFHSKNTSFSHKPLSKWKMEMHRETVLS